MITLKQLLKYKNFVKSGNIIDTELVRKDKFSDDRILIDQEFRTKFDSIPLGSYLFVIYVTDGVEKWSFDDHRYIDNDGDDIYG